MARIVTENDIGKGLAIEDNKLVAKVSTASGNAIQATEEGLCAYCGRTLGWCGIRQED